ncbi:MAG: DUF2877 domain-containing protein [Acidobacteriota bacterium]
MSTAAIHPHSAPSLPQPVVPVEGVAACGRVPEVPAPGVVLDVATIGYLVLAEGFGGRVHSVFASACNLLGGDMLLTIAAWHVGDGPATLRLAGSATLDLRAVFDVGESVGSHGGVLRAGRVELSLRRVQVWRPVAPACPLPPERIDVRLQAVAASLAQCDRGQSSILGSDGAATVAALRDACRTLDVESAVRHATRLVGWGEGLTPAGDDFLIGLLAGLDAFVAGDDRRGRMRGAIAALVTLCARRTTPIAAHYLKLAAGGHYNEPLVGLRNALLAEDDRHAVDAALHRALAIGASSGADTARGLLAGLNVWLPPYTGAAVNAMPGSRDSCG